MWILISWLTFYSVSALGMNCPKGTYHVRSYRRAAYHRADGTFVNATQVRESCRSKDATYDLWRPKFKNGYPLNWESPDEKVAKWTEEERERVLEALGTLPEDLRRVSISGIYRLARSHFYPNPASLNEVGDTLMLYDSAFGQDRNLARILAHEFAHSLYGELGESGQSEYRSAVGWSRKLKADGQTFVWADRLGQYVEDDGRSGPKEDFANNLEYFLFQPSVLKQKTPKAYDWIQRKFGDKFKVGGRQK